MRCQTSLKVQEKEVHVTDELYRLLSIYSAYLIQLLSNQAWLHKMSHTSKPVFRVLKGSDHHGLACIFCKKLEHAALCSILAI